jgi:hypothetical protein
MALESAQVFRRLNPDHYAEIYFPRTENGATELLLPYFPHISNGISGEFPGRVLSLSGASAPVVNLHVHISFSLAFPDKP